MAQKKQTIVIKKIIVQGGGHHGGSWKVALADFMTALMAFFLVMWLIGQNEETKKAISDYFSIPSLIEYNFQNFGAEITLEKLFLDFVNEPMKAFQSFLEPADKTPNVLDMGSARVVAAFMADKMTDKAKNVSISQDGFEFDIPDHFLFEKGTSKPKAEFVQIMEKLTGITSGLQDSQVKLTSALFVQLVADKSQSTANRVAQERLDLVKNKVAATFEHGSNDINGNINVRDKKGVYEVDKLIGFIHVSIKQKESKDASKKKRPLDMMFGDAEESKGVYDNFAKQVSERKSKKAANGEDPNLVNPVDLEVQGIQQQANPHSQED